jgi:hypothetical protein
MTPIPLVFQKPLIVAVRYDFSGDSKFARIPLSEGLAGKFVVTADGEQLSRLRLYALLGDADILQFGLDFVRHVDVFDVIMGLVKPSERIELENGIFIGGGYVRRDLQTRRIESDGISSQLGSVPSTLLRELLRLKGHAVEILQDEVYHSRTLGENPHVESWYLERGFEIKRPQRRSFF